MINEKIDSILAEIQDAKAKTEKDIEELRVHLLGKRERSPSFSKSSATSRPTRKGNSARS